MKFLKRHYFYYYLNMNNDSDIHKSLKIVSEMLTDRGVQLNTLSDNYSIENIRSMERKNKIEFYITPDNNKKYCIKYLIQKIRPTMMKLILEELTENYELNPEDTNIIIILKDPPGQTVDKVINNYILQKGYFIQTFLLKNLIFNITHHTAVPRHSVLSKQGCLDIIESLNLKNRQQLPIILKSDPVAKYFGMRPGDICKIERNSLTSGISIGYRLCR